MTTQVKLPTFKSKETKKNQYVLDGQKYYRVTSILNAINKPALMPWKAQVTLDKANRVLSALEGTSVTIDQAWIDSVIETARAEPDFVLDTATTFGSNAHYALEQYIANGVVPHDMDMFRVIGAFNSWAKSNQIELLPNMCEVTVAHSDGYAGTIDAVAIKGDELVIVDWKTSNGLYAEHMLQVSAYAKALQLATGVPVNEAWIVRFPREKPEPGDSDFHWVHLGIKELNSNFDLFRAAQKLYVGTQLAAGQKVLHDGTGVLPEKKKKP
jgi:hypothetical protein